MDNKQENNEQMNVYGMYIQKYFCDLQHLQLQHGRLWQSYRELQIKSSKQTGGHHSNNPHHHHNDTKTDDELRQELEQEKMINKSLTTEMAQIVDNMKTLETRHKEFLAIFNKDNKQDSRIKELENENKELRETLDFVTSENTVFKDLEERAFNEKREWIEEKKKFEEVVVWSKHLNDKYKTTLAQNEKYGQQMDKFLNCIHDTFIQCSNDNDLSLLIEDFRKCSINNESFDKKLEIAEKFLKSLPKQHSDIVNNNDNNNNNKLDSKLKISDQQKENIQCLKTEIAELKNLLINNGMSLEQINLKLENTELSEKLRLKEETLEKLKEKFARNRAVLEENHRRSLDEIKTLDNFIAIIINKLNKLPEDLKKHNELKELITIVNENDSDPDNI
ncbi:hypothetical protein HUG17_4320 [Dermatophagoides farinae]|uniref:Uncharacterized protein n=1 Tax=Dermatophagoides farinae TaxID=6954 RepID=A0A9D4NY98_DERFA|nr:hypothetical protein HUG17_4320 [Dermatophagoides farinae]